MARLDPKHFTRCRTLTLPTVLSFLLSSVHAAVQSELDQFFANLRNRADSVREATAQAFYQARYKINALVFGEVNQHLMGLVVRTLADPALERLAGGRGGWQRGSPDDDEGQRPVDRHRHGFRPLPAGYRAVPELPPA